MGNALEREFTEEDTECVYCPKCGHKYEIQMDMVYARTSMTCKKCATPLKLRSIEGHVLLAYQIPMERRLSSYVKAFGIAP